MINMVMYTEPEELENLTGLTHEELWDKGFNLDDWNVGFQTDREIPEGWLLWRMKNYCVGYEHTEYKGKHYYMVYHS